MRELSPAARALLGQERAHVDALAGDGHAGWQAIARRVERGESPLELDAPPRATSRRALAIAAVAVVAVAAVLVAWLAAGTHVLAELGDEAPSAAAYGAASDGRDGTAELRAPEATRARARREAVVDAAEATASTAVVEAAVAVATLEPVAAHEPVATHAPARVEPVRSGKRSPRGPAIADADDEREQIRALATARSALRDGDAGTALRVLKALAREHPKSAYAEEREVLVVAALCAAGRTDEAATLAARFRRAHAGSPLAAHLERGCAGSP